MGKEGEIEICLLLFYAKDMEVWEKLEIITSKHHTVIIIALMILLKLA